MAAKIITLGDPGDHPGNMVTASGSATAGGRKICVKGDIFECHRHGRVPVLFPKSKVNCAGIQILTEGDVTDCGCSLIATVNITAG